MLMNNMFCTTCFGLLGHHQVAKFYKTKYIVADVEISSSGQNLYMKYKLCMSRYGGILGGGHLPWALSLLVLGGGVPDGE